MSTKDDEAALAEAVREDEFHLLRLRVRHRIEMGVEPRNEALAEAADDPCGFDALLVILEALLRREAGHADVISGLAVAARVAKIHDVDVMVIAGVLDGSDTGRLWSDCCHRNGQVQDLRYTCSTSSAASMNSASSGWKGSPSVSSAACSIRGTRSIGSSVLISSPPLAA
jgi:hypothetical protein